MNALKITKFEPLNRNEFVRLLLASVIDLFLIKVDGQTNLLSKNKFSVSKLNNFSGK